MDSREYFESVLSHFLVVHKNDNGHGYTISDLKLIEGTLKLTFRDASEKALLDDINTLKFPLIEDLIEEDRTFRILPSQENSDELTLQCGNEISNFSSNFNKNMNKNDILVLELTDLKNALKLGLTVINLNLAKYDFGLVREMRELREIVKRKYSI